MGIDAYMYGVRQGRMPEPYVFIFGSAAMLVAAIVGQAYEPLGAILAWGFLIGAFLYQVNTGALK